MRVLPIIALFCLSAPSAFAAASFRIIAQNDFVGGTLSSDGSTVGVQQASASASASLYRTATGQFTATFGSTGPIAIAISGDGSIAQIWKDGHLSEYRNRRETPATALPAFLPVALSDDGEISIGTSISPTAAYRKIWGVDGTLEPLGDLVGGGTETRAIALSGNGEIVVGVGDSSKGREAFRWEAGVIAGLGDLAGGAFESQANGISRDGSTIVGYGTTNLGREAFRYRAGVMEGLGNLPGAPPRSIAAAASHDGSIVVGSAGDAPFIWDEALGMRDLRVVLAGLGVDIRALESQGLLIGGATDISSDGRTILGGGFNTAVGKSFLWVAVVPEPSSAILLAFGLGGLSEASRTRRERRQAGLPFMRRRTAWDRFTLASMVAAVSVFASALLLFPPAALAGAFSDADSDLVPDAFDNGRTAANGPNQFLGSNQSDSDGDGYGNRCDTDFDQSGTTSTADFGRFLGAFGTSACIAIYPPPPACVPDLDGSGTVTTADFGIFLGRFSAPPGVPGPSGLACARFAIRIDLGDVPCAP